MALWRSRIVVVYSRSLQERKALIRGCCWGLTRRSTADTERLVVLLLPEIGVQPVTLSSRTEILTGSHSAWATYRVEEVQVLCRGRVDSQHFVVLVGFLLRGQWGDQGQHQTETVQNVREILMLKILI